MKRFRTVAALFLALTLLCALPTAALAEDYPAKTGELAADYTGKTVVLHTNDVHGALEGYAAAAWLKKEVQARGAEVLLVDVGDFAQGSVYVNDNHGTAAVGLMNAAGYDLAILGNHEFDYGQETLLAMAGAADFPVICANVLRDGELLLTPNHIWRSASGLTLGFFGVDTPETMTKTSPSLVRGLHFMEGALLAACISDQAAQLRAQGADLVIELAHLGVNAESSPNGSADLYHATTGVDFIFDGHSHNVMTEGPEGEPIQSTGTKFAHVGVLVIDNAARAIEDHFLLPVEGLGADETVKAAADAIIAEVDTAYDSVIGESLVELTGERPDNRGGESNHGDFICDAMRWYILKDPEALKVDADHLVAVLNGGNIRAAVSPGPVTRKEIKTVVPFENTLCVIYVTGAELLEVLEASTFVIPELSGGFSQTAGLEWTIDATKPYDRGAAYPDSTYYAPNSIRRVSIQRVNGQPFDPAATYAIVGNDFMADGGDTYSLLARSEHFDTGFLLEEIIAAYVQEALGGVIGADYAAPQGRLRILTLENSVCVPAAQTVNGTAVEAYEINGEAYVKLRDAAMALSGGASQFEVRYDPEQNAVVMETGKAYTPVGGELQPGPDRSAGLAVSEQSFLVDGEAVNLVAYVLAGHNYCRLSDLAALLGIAA